MCGGARQLKIYCVRFIFLEPAARLAAARHGTGIYTHVYIQKKRSQEAAEAEEEEKAGAAAAGRTCAEV